jgi:hypothetical protein
MSRIRPALLFVSEDQLRKFRCIEKCYWNGQLFEVGDEWLAFSKAAEEDPMLVYFEEVKVGGETSVQASSEPVNFIPEESRSVEIDPAQGFQGWPGQVKPLSHVDKLSRIEKTE